MTKILNSKGEPIVLNAMEQRVARHNQSIVNALGYEIDITTLTTIMKKVTEQKFFLIAPADYLPVRVGEGAWSTSLLTYRSFDLAEDFETGLVNTGSSGARTAQADAGVDSVSVPVKNWVKGISWNLMDLQHAAKSGNWDLVTAKERSRKRNWDLGIQRTAFLGLKSNANVKGMLTQADVTVDTTLIPAKISTMTPAQLNTFVTEIVDAYRVNNNRTAMPTHFVMPETAYNGMVSFIDANFAIKTKLDYLLEAFRTITLNPSFKILPIAYADPAFSNGLLTKPRYTLLNYEEESLRLDIPVDYTNTLANSTDSFNFQNVGYGQFTGAKAYRPLEMLYLDDQTA